MHHRIAPSPSYYVHCGLSHSKFKLRKHGQTDRLTFWSRVPRAGGLVLTVCLYHTRLIFRLLPVWIDGSLLSVRNQDQADEDVVDVLLCDIKTKSRGEQLLL